MKISMDSVDLRDAVREWLKTRDVNASNIDVNIHAAGGAFVRADIIVRKDVDGTKPRARRIPVVGTAS